MVKRASVILTILIIFLFSGIDSVLADSYRISSYIVDINILEDGSAAYEEKITYSFSGSFNGILYDLDLDKTTGAEEFEIYVLKDSGPVPFEQNNSRSPGTYFYETGNNIVNFTIFEPSGSGEKTFVIKYILLDVAEKFNDTAQFNRKIIGTGWKVTLEDIKINITLPEGAAIDDISIFGHGPLTGESRIVSGNQVEFIVPELNAGQFVETRVLFPTYLIPESTNTINRNALEEIMNQEKVLAEKANEVRDIARSRVKLYTLMSVIFYLLIISWIFLFIRTYIRYDKEHKTDFKGKYYRELPGNYTPAEMSILMSMGRVTPKDIMATLMDLVRKKVLLLEEITVMKRVFIREKEQKDYKFTKNPSGNFSALKEHEVFLINWFIDKIGGGDSFLLDDIKEYSKDKKNALLFKADYDIWCERTKKTAEKNNFLYKNMPRGTGPIIALSFVYLLAGFLMPLLMGYSPAFLLIILGFILMIYTATIKKRTLYGNDQYTKWKAFKRFLKDFSRMHLNEVPSIIIWEHYLVYAISLGIAKQVIKQLPLVIKEDDFQNPGLSYLYIMSYGRFGNFENNFNRTINTIQTSISSATAIANSKNSSTTGRGGGFSGGSSGGGGGGGGGGAF